MRAKAKAHRPSLLLVGLSTFVAAGLTGCGGKDEGRVQMDSYELPAGSYEGCSLMESLELTPIEGGDFESRTVGWSATGDSSATTCGALVDCPQDSSKECDDESVETSERIGSITGGMYTGVLATYGGSLPDCDLGERGAHLRAVGLCNWGGELYKDFSSDPLDASGYDGIAFWARRGRSDVGSALFIAFEDKYTKEAAYTTGIDEDGNTVFYCWDSPISSEKCDRFGVGVGLEMGWRYFKVPFANAQQRGYGKSSDHLHTEELYGVAIYWDVGDWDFWIDEISFYKEKEQ